MKYPGYQPTIGIEVHAVMKTKTKLFCNCPVVNPVHAEPNTAICPVCTGIPGAMPVLNRHAVEQALRVSLALGCHINQTSIFARKSYFYPDLPKGYQISQYELPIAENGHIQVHTSEGIKTIRIHRAHIEEDTGKLQHRIVDGKSVSLVDLNRSSVPLLEIVTEPDMHSVEEVRAYAEMLIKILRYTGVNDGELELGMLRIEPNVSLKKIGQDKLGDRTEVKNLNSVRSLERAVAFELDRQYQILIQGGKIKQQTVGWDETNQITIPQRSKEDAEDYRYFPEPDLPPLIIDDQWLAQAKAQLPELPFAKQQRFQQAYQLPENILTWLVAEKDRADFFEATLAAAPTLSPSLVATWQTNELTAILKTAPADYKAITPANFALILTALQEENINRKKAKSILTAHIQTNADIQTAIQNAKSKAQLSSKELTTLVQSILANHQSEVEKFHSGNQATLNWLFGQIMQAVKGQANADAIKNELNKQLEQK